MRTLPFSTCITFIHVHSNSNTFGYGMKTKTRTKKWGRRRRQHYTRLAQGNIPLMGIGKRKKKTNSKLYILMGIGKGWFLEGVGKWDIGGDGNLCDCRWIFPFPFPLPFPFLRCCLITNIYLQYTYLANLMWWVTNIVKPPNQYFFMNIAYLRFFLSFLNCCLKVLNGSINWCIVVRAIHYNKQFQREEFSKNEKLRKISC